MISICMIVKNEARHLAATLASLAPHFDDIVIVDTGSDDDTKAIARRFTDNVHDFAWVNDFSAARNASLHYARHDWVLVVDADEALESLDKTALEALTAAHPQSVGRVERINYLDEGAGVAIVRERVSRLFAKAFYHYSGIIHEQVTPRTGATAETFLAPVTLNHVGYQKAVLQQTNKLVRNITLLKQALQTQPQNPYLWYQLGKSHYLQEAYPAAIEAFQQALGFEINFALEYAEDLIETYGYALINQGDYAAALDIISFEHYYRSADFLFLKALILMNNARLQEAVDTFLYCTTLPPGNKEGVNSFKARYNIGVILEVSGMKPEALAFYQQCGAYPPAQEGVKRLNG